ncbi:MAG TPA: DUF2079 domain-containing protein [Galbitalea sp.]
MLLASSRRWLRCNRLPLAFFAALTALYSTLAIRRHLTFHTAGWDLGIFEQAIRNYAALRPPIAILKGPDYNLLGDHFHPILMLVAPIYAAIPSPVTLLVVQAVLFALAVVPLMGWAGRALGQPASIAVGLVYGLSFGIASALGFDFHEIAFAVPMIAFSLSALGQGRLRAAAAWALPLILVKEDLGLTVVAVVGILIARRGARRLGILTAVVGAVATVVEIAVILPSFNTSGGYGYWSKVSAHPILTVLFTSSGEKLTTLFVTLGVAGFACLLSPIALAAVPTLLWRFASDDKNYWGTGYHYSAVLMPIMVAALIDGLCRLHRRRCGLLAMRGSSSAQRQQTTATRGLSWAARACMTLALLVTAALIPDHALAQLASPELWTVTARDAAITRALALIPDNVRVAATDDIVPHLTSRDSVTLFGLRPLVATRPEWILVDAHSPRHFLISDSRQLEDLLEAEKQGYGVVMQSHGVTLLKRPAP